MKKTVISLCSVILILLSFTFAGCKTVKPYEIEWHLDKYFVDGEYYRYVGFDYYDHFGCVFSDCAQISFKGDGSFYFKDKEGVEYNGTYKSKKTRYNTEVILTFPDGSEFAGSYWQFDYDEIIYSAQFEIAGVNYYFDDKERKFDKDDYDRCLKNLASAICTYAADGRMEVEHYPYYENLKRAVIGKVDGSFVALTGNNVYLLNNENCWCYSVSSEEIERSELKEGDCIIRTGYNYFAIYYPDINS